jgi:hypothetical protein
LASAYNLAMDFDAEVLPISFSVVAYKDGRISFSVGKFEIYSLISKIAPFKSKLENFSASLFFKFSLLLKIKVELREFMALSYIQACGTPV